jgi:hypothetical protein
VGGLEFEHEEAAALDAHFSSLTGYQSVTRKKLNKRKLAYACTSCHILKTCAELPTHPEVSRRFDANSEVYSRLLLDFKSCGNTAFYVSHSLSEFEYCQVGGASKASAIKKELAYFIVSRIRRSGGTQVAAIAYRTPKAYTAPDMRRLSRPQWYYYEVR